MLVTMVSAMLVRSLYAMYAINFINGFCMSGKVTVAFIYGREFYPNRRWKIIFSTCFMLVEGITAFVIPIYFRFISK
jgi:hypothetical protein